MTDTSVPTLSADRNLPLVQQHALRWAAEASHIVVEAWLAERATLETNVKSVGISFGALHPLGSSCVSTSESALLLVNSLKAWDADILVRSVVEGTMKYLHLAHGTPSERAAKYHEFDVDLPEISRLKHSQRLTRFLAVIPNHDADEWRPFRDLLLAPEELARLETAYPRKTRQKLERRWSFGGIVGEMERSPGHPFAAMRHLLHGYGMSSHILHQDSDGIGIVHDRLERSQERRDAVTLGHCARIISDILTMAILRAHVAYVLTGEKPDDLRPLIDRWTAIEQSMRTAREAFHRIEYCS